MKTWGAILLCLFPLALEAEETAFIKYGVGILSKDQNSYADVKTLSFGYQNNLFIEQLVYKLEPGIVVDNRGGNSFGYVSASFGVPLHLGAFYMEACQGVGAISTTDRYLGSHLQFFHDLGIGLQDNNTGNRIGVVYKHISNAGIKAPNQGRDFFTVQVGFGL